MDSDAPIEPEVERNSQGVPVKRVRKEVLEAHPEYAGLRPFKASGNPGGKPHGCSVLAPFLANLAAHDGHGARRLAEVLEQRLLDGESVADIIKILDRTDGPVIRESTLEVKSTSVEIRSVPSTQMPERSSSIEAHLARIRQDRQERAG